MIEYSIVTINYKTAGKVEALWKSLHKHLTPGSFEFILLDNNSGESEIDKLNKFFNQKKEVHLIPMQKNLGFGGGYAEAVRFAQGECLVLINPDIELTSDSLTALKEALESHVKAGIVAPQLKNPDGTIQQNARGWPTLLGLITRRFGKTESVLSGGTVPWVQGSFMMLRRRFFTEVLKGFDTRFFLFFEDTDLCRRTWLAGFEVLLVPSAEAIHGDKRLSGNDIFRAMTRKTFWIHVLSAIKYFWKYKHQPVPQI